MDKLINIAIEIYECLSKDPRVISPGSIRSYIYAIADFLIRAQMSRSDDLLVRVFAQNLRGSLKMREGNLGDVLRDAIRCVEISADLHRVPVTLTGTGVDKDRAPHLAQIINRYIDKYSNPKEKYLIAKKLFGEKKLEKYYNIPYEAWINEADLFKSSIAYLRPYTPGAPPSDVDLLSTSRNFARKLALRRPLSDSDIVLREYRKSRRGGFAICLDVSGSMKEYVGNATKLQIALGSIARFIDRLKGEDVELSLILFNVEADILWAPYSAATYGEYMKALLPYVFPAGGTDLAAALKLIAEEDLGDEVLIISDGRTADPDAALEYAKKVRARIHAFTMEESPVLRRITALRGGTYRTLMGRSL